MQAVTILAPALAPLAVKLIDKYIFDENGQRRMPKIIHVPAPPQYICCCGRSTDEYNTETQTCSTCGPTKSSHYRPSRLCLPTKSTVRSSSTSSAFENEKIKSSNSRIRTHSDSKMISSISADSRYSNEDTLAVLARNLKQQISNRHSEKQTLSHYYPKPSTIERSSSKAKTSSSASSSNCGSRKVCSKSVSDSIQGSSRKRNQHSSDGCRVLKKY